MDINEDIKAKKIKESEITRANLKKLIQKYSPLMKTIQEKFFVEELFDFNCFKNSSIFLTATFFDRFNILFLIKTIWKEYLKDEEIIDELENDYVIYKEILGEMIIAYNDLRGDNNTWSIIKTKKRFEDEPYENLLFFIDWFSNQPEYTSVMHQKYISDLLEFKDEKRLGFVPLSLNDRLIPDIYEDLRKWKRLQYFNGSIDQLSKILKVAFSMKVKSSTIATRIKEAL